LIYTEYLTGAPPPFDVATYHEPAVAVRHGETLRIPRAAIAPELADLVDRMLSADAARRPTIGEVHATLMAIRPTADAARPSRRSAPTALRGKGLRTAFRPTPDSAPSGTGLVGKLLHKLTDRPAR
jgi:hypothetical protein